MADALHYQNHKISRRISMSNDFRGFIQRILLWIFSGIKQWKRIGWKIIELGNKVKWILAILLAIASVILPSASFYPYTLPIIITLISLAIFFAIIYYFIIQLFYKFVLEERKKRNQHTNRSDHGV